MYSIKYSLALVLAILNSSDLVGGTGERAGYVDGFEVRSAEYKLA